MIYSEGQNGEFGLDFWVLLKTVRIGGLQAENKIKEKCKIEPHLSVRSLRLDS